MLHRIPDTKCVILEGEKGQAERNSPMRPRAFTGLAALWQGRRIRMSHGYLVEFVKVTKQDVLVESSTREIFYQAKGNRKADCSKQLQTLQETDTSVTSFILSEPLVNMVKPHPYCTYSQTGNPFPFPLPLPLRRPPDGKGLPVLDEGEPSGGNSFSSLRRPTFRLWLDCP